MFKIFKIPIRSERISVLDKTREADASRVVNFLTTPASQNLCLPVTLAPTPSRFSDILISCYITSSPHDSLPYQLEGSNCVVCVVSVASQAWPNLKRVGIGKRLNHWQNTEDLKKLNISVDASDPESTESLSRQFKSLTSDPDSSVITLATNLGPSQPGARTAGALDFSRLTQHGEVTVQRQGTPGICGVKMRLFPGWWSSLPPTVSPLPPWQEGHRSGVPLSGVFGPTTGQTPRPSLARQRSSRRRRRSHPLTLSRFFPASDSSNALPTSTVHRLHATATTPDSSVLKRARDSALTTLRTRCHPRMTPDSAEVAFRLAPDLISAEFDRLQLVLHHKDAAQRRGHSRVRMAPSLCCSDSGLRLVGPRGKLLSAPQKNNTQGVSVIPAELCIESGRGAVQSEWVVSVLKTLAAAASWNRQRSAWGRHIVQEPWDMRRRRGGLSRARDGQCMGGVQKNADAGVGATRDVRVGGRAGVRCVLVLGEPIRVGGIGAGKFSNVDGTSATHELTPDQWAEPVRVWGRIRRADARLVAGHLGVQGGAGRIGVEPQVHGRFAGAWAERVEGVGRGHHTTRCHQSNYPDQEIQDIPLETLIMLAVLFGKAEKPCTQRDSKKVMEEELLMQALAEKEEDNIPFDGAIEIDPDDKYLFRL
ncbi:hypothetical protein B0H10DRAFT_1949949 [Mycena sp. CBHHK59/15]|nr:hypothetical protein B0H10DRAFT_1949949 [Mycena sp. CBHHK59/15]